MGSCFSNCSQAAVASSATDDMEDDGLARVLGGLSLKSADDEEMSYMSHRVLDGPRRQIMATAFPEVSAGKVVAVLAKSGGSDVQEFTVKLKDDSLDDPQIVMGNCQITYEDLTPGECIEFSFGEEPDVWFMAQLSQEALETYRSMKFDAWKGMLVKPTCEAQFRRMLQIGMISELYDPTVFPTPEAQKASYQVTDERTGKLIELPHPVKGLRIWDASNQMYKSIETRLAGAPGTAEAEKWWAEFMQSLNSQHGAEYLAGLLANK